MDMHTQISPPVFAYAYALQTILDHQGTRSPHCCVLRAPPQQQLQQGSAQPGVSAPAAMGGDALLMVRVFFLFWWRCALFTL